MKIGIVNDLPLAVAALRRAISHRPDHRILWVAADGEQAVDFCGANPPDLVLMDLVMPRVDGVAATRRIMERSPCAILIVTASVDANKATIYEAMGAGALDAVDTPTLAQGMLADASQPLLDKIDQIGRQLATRGPVSAVLQTLAASPAVAPLVAIGASAGGPTALAALLKPLPADFPAPIVIVQHVDKAFAIGMAEWLDGFTQLPVRIATQGGTPQRGEVLLAATNDHLRLTARGLLDYTAHPEETPYRPSVDVFFQSVVDHWRGDAIGVLLTGMGRDGALGLKAMRTRGFYTIAQDAASSAVYGMPKAAAAIDAASAILPLDRIAERITLQLQRVARPR